VIRAYFAAAERDDTDALVECFAHDAVVSDEDQTWQGRSQIRQWRETVATKFDYTIRVRDLVARGRTDDGDHFDVPTHLEGNFPGGTVDLDFGFVLRSDLIARLEIVAPKAH
jgi:ketosteroid isomerase-like protein